MKLSAHERETIVKALRFGLVPKIGLQHIQVGRATELRALAKDTDHLAHGGSTVRLIIGSYGAGKTFLLNMARLMATQSGIVVMSAELTPNRRLHASQGQARLLYTDLARSAASKTRPTGGAIEMLLERFTHQMAKDAATTGQSLEDTTERNLQPVLDLPGGYDFIDVIQRFQDAHERDRPQQRSGALKWMHGEYGSRTEAKQELGVRRCVDDQNVYEHLRLMAAFVRCSGAHGLLVTIDELSALIRLNSAQARRNNYDQLVHMLNDVYQGVARWIGFLLAGTPETIEDERRGLHSHEALASRLQENTYATEELADIEQPMIRLANLRPEDLYLLLTKVRDIMMKKSRVSDKGIRAFMAHCYERIGAAYFRTPRNTVRAWVNLLSLLDQHPEATWQSVLAQTDVREDVEGTAGDEWEESDSESDKLKDLAL